MTLPLALIGAGLMGSLHAHATNRSGRARVAVVVDRDEVRGASLAGAVGATWKRSLEDAEAHLGACVGAIVATPTDTHRAITCDLLDRGLHVLLEKPMASTSEEAQEILQAAANTGLVLAVGHVERFNPAAMELSNLVQDPVFVQTHRLSPYGGQTRDGVVLDLMLHDLDLIHLLDASPPEWIATALVNSRSPTEDLATCTMKLESGLVCQLNASRISQRKVRRIQVTMTDGVLEADLLLRTIHVSRDTCGELVDEGTRRYRQRTVTEIPWVSTGGEPLVAQLHNFLDAVACGRSPHVTAQDGARAVQLCERVLAAAAPVPTQA